MNQTGFSLKRLGSDIPSSIVVFLVALPLCLGIALASNAPLFSGLIAGIVGGIVIGSISGSQLSVSGPAAGLTAIVAAAILKLPSFEVFLLSVVICGVLQLVLGFIRAGVLGDYVPNSVIRGMLAAIGVILILNQVPYLIGGAAAEPEGGIFNSFLNGFANIHPVALAIGVIGLVLQIFWEKLSAGRKAFRFLPAPLIVVFLAIGINYFLADNGGLSGHYLVAVPEASSAGEFFSFFTHPDLSAILSTEVWITGITLALVASLESLLCIEAVDELDPYQRVTDKDRELKAQGVGNIVSGVLGGLPVTSVIVRSSANVNSGAKTRMSAIMHGVLLLVLVAFIPAFLNLIPKAGLAAILIYTGYKLAKPALFMDFYRKGRNQFLPFIITVLAIVLTDLLMGVVIGICVGLFFSFYSNFKTSVFIVHDRDKYFFRLRKDVTFLNKPIIKTKLEAVPEYAEVNIDASRADYIDPDVREVIEDFIKHAPLKNIRVKFKESRMPLDHFKERELQNGTLETVA